MWYLFRVDQAVTAPCIENLTVPRTLSCRSILEIPSIIVLLRSGPAARLHIITRIFWDIYWPICKRASIFEMIDHNSHFSRSALSTRTRSKNRMYHKLPVLHSAPVLDPFSIEAET